MRISDWSSDVCFSDLKARNPIALTSPASAASKAANCTSARWALPTSSELGRRLNRPGSLIVRPSPMPCRQPFDDESNALAVEPDRSEEHTSELQSLMRISYAVFCLKKKKQIRQTH